MPIAVRFSESERYDITLDENVVCFMALIDRGCYWAEVPCKDGAGKRALRQEFKERAIEAIRQGYDPCKLEVELESG